MEDWKRLEKIEIALAKKGLKKYQAAALAGITPSIFGFIITGRVIASEDEKNQICKVLGQKDLFM